MAVEQFVTVYAVELASSWVNMMLFMLEIVMCLRYFQRSTFRPLQHKIGVGAIIFFDTLCTISINVDVFATFLVFIQKESPVALLAPSALTILFTYSTAVIEQFFLCHLYFIITRKRIVSLGLAFLGLVHVGLSFSAAIMLLTSPTNHSLSAITGAGAIACGITDLLIAGCLAYELFKIRRSQSSKSGVLRRVFILSVSSGVVVASTTILMMILFLKGDIAFEFFFSCQGRVYALTLLLNFLSGTSSGNAGGSQDNSAFFSINSKPRPPASIYSNASQESLNKELPALPVTAGLQITTLTQISSAHFSNFSASSPGVWTPRTPATPRTIISAPYRISSLPFARAPSGPTT
ncbi:hypothetical protein K438DRAFT_2008534 [Mycena galopus ATCC 62051]|nr:hypothetical protein K438DRAFT_2008534 [Mycena galopus ATCC 62051]